MPKAILDFNFVSKLHIWINVRLSVGLYVHPFIFVAEIYPNY